MISRLISYLLTPLGQFFALLGLYLLFAAAPIPITVAVATLFFLRWERFDRYPEPWWRMKAVILFGTLPIVAAVTLSPAVYPLGAFMLLLNMATTLRYPESLLEGLNGVLGICLMCWAAVFGWSPLPGDGMFSFPLPWWWIGAYTLWNHVFAAVRFPAAAAHSVALLAAPLVVAAAFGPGSWLFARGVTLSLGVIIGMAVLYQSEKTS